MKTAYAIPLALALLAPPAPALGQVSGTDQVSDTDRGIARQLTVKGLEALDRRDFAAAEQSFTRASALLWAPTIGLGLARARAGLGKLVQAREAYSRVAHTSVPADASAAFKQAIADAQQELNALTPRVSSVLVRVKGPAVAQVAVDGQPMSAAAAGLPLPADPGKHVVRASAPGFAPAETTVTLAEGGNATVDIELKPGNDTTPEALPPNAMPAGTTAAVRPSGWNAQRTWALTSGGVGVVGLAVGGVLTGLAASKNSDSKSVQYCSPTHPNVCDAQGLSLRQDAGTLADAATAALVVGGVLAAGGLTLWLTAPSSERPQTGSVEVVPAAAGADIGLGLRRRW